MDLEVSWLRLEAVLILALILLLLTVNAAEESFVDDESVDLGVDMFPEKEGLRASSSKPPIQVVVNQDVMETELTEDQKKELREEFGTDRCPEKGAFDSNEVNGVQIDSNNEIPAESMTSGFTVIHGEVAELQRLLMKQREAVADLDRLLQLQLQSVNAFARIAETHQVGNPEGINRDSRPDHKGTPGHLQGGVEPRREKMVVRKQVTWADHFEFLSAVKVDSEASCLAVLPQVGEEGVSRYLAVGDTSGKLYVFSPHGDLVFEYVTLSRAAVSALLAFTVRRNETWLVSGHADGAVLVHELAEAPRRREHSEGVPPLSIRVLHVLIPPSDKLVPDAASSTAPSEEDNWLPDAEVISLDGISAKPGDPTSAQEAQITNLEQYRSGSARYILVTDRSGIFRVFRSNGTLYRAATCPSRPLACLRTPSSQRLLFLTPEGAGSLDLRTMAVKTAPCRGLNESQVIAYVLDASGRSRAHGVTAGGELVQVALTGDTIKFECHIRLKKPVRISNPTSLASIKGYLLAASAHEIAIWNTTTEMSLFKSPAPSGPRHLLTVSRKLIAAQLGLGLPPALQPGSDPPWPALAANGERLVAFTCGGGVVAMFRSRMPVTATSGRGQSIWSSPVFVALVLLVGGWQFAIHRRSGSEGNASGERRLTPLRRSELHSGFSTSFPDFEEPIGRGRPLSNIYSGVPARRLTVNSERGEDRGERPSRPSMERPAAGPERPGVLERRGSGSFMGLPQPPGSKMRTNTTYPPSRRDPAYLAGPAAPSISR